MERTTKLRQMPTLFDKKTMYELTHDRYGRTYKSLCMRKYQRQKRNVYNLHLIDGLSFSPKNSFPIVAPYTGPTDFEIFPFTKRQRLSGSNQAIHFFVDDYLFWRHIVLRLEHTTAMLFKFDYIFAPDFSLYVDVPEHINKHSVYLSRLATAYWQQCGYNVIPTASWGNANSFEYCFESLPQNSVIAVGGIGHHHCSAAIELWQIGIRMLEKELSPTLIIVYGPEEVIPGINTPVKFFIDDITKYHRNGYKQN